MKYLLGSMIFSAFLFMSAMSFAATVSMSKASGVEATACSYENIVSAAVTASAGANTSGIAAQGAGVRVYLNQVIIFNNGTANGSMIITDGSGGTTKAKVPFPASTGSTIVLKPAIPFTANTAIFVDPSGSDNIDVTLIGCLNHF